MGWTLAATFLLGKKGFDATQHQYRRVSASFRPERKKPYFSPTRNPSPPPSHLQSTSPLAPQPRPDPQPDQLPQHALEAGFAAAAPLAPREQGHTAAADAQTTARALREHGVAAAVAGRAEGRGVGVAAPLEGPGVVVVVVVVVVSGALEVGAGERGGGGVDGKRGGEGRAWLRRR